MVLCKEKYRGMYSSIFWTKLKPLMCIYMYVQYLHFVSVIKENVHTMKILKMASALSIFHVYHLQQFPISLNYL